MKDVKIPELIDRDKLLEIMSREHSIGRMVQWMGRLLHHMARCDKKVTKGD